MWREWRRPLLRMHYHYCFVQVNKHIRRELNSSSSRLARIASMD
jgi:hypothetical protein